MAEEKKTRRSFTNEFRLKAVRRLRQLQRQHPTKTISQLAKQIGVSEGNLHNWKAMEKRGVFRERPGKQIVNRVPGSRRTVTGSHELMLVIQNGSYEMEIKSEGFALKQSGKISSGKALRETIESAFLGKLGH